MNAIINFPLPKPTTYDYAQIYVQPFLEPGLLQLFEVKAE